MGRRCTRVPRKKGAESSQRRKEAAARKAAGAKRTEARPPAERIKAIVRILDRTYPGATTALRHENAFQLLVATILSAQCTDERVNKVTEGLFQKYRTARDFARADPRELQEEVKPTGFYRNKAKAIRGAAQVLNERFGGEVPQSMDALLALPGVARKTANVVLGTCFGIPSGVVVDTHVRRVSQRLGLVTSTAPEKIEKELMALVPKRRWISFSHQMIRLGRDICQARNPKCEVCPLRKLCPSVEVPGA